MGQVYSAVVTPAVIAGASAKILDIGEVPTYESTDTNVVKVSVVSPVAQAAQGATNFLTLQLRVLRGNPAVSQGVVASIPLSTVALVADVPVQPTSIPLPSVQSGDVLELYGLQTGTGGALPINTRIDVELE